MGNKAAGKEYEYIWEMGEISQQFIRIQIAVAFLAIKGETDSRKIMHKTGLIAPVVSNYLNQMNCATVIEDAGEPVGSGDTPSLVIRNSLAGDNCEGCQRANNCIIKLGKLHSSNLKSIPQTLARRMII